MIDLDRIIAQSFVRQAEWLPEVDSTNTLALQTIDGPAPLPRLIGAESQTRGRGRNNHSWWSSSGALTFSLLLSPAEFGISRPLWPRLSLVTGLAVCRALEEFLQAAQVQWKWPNDVYVNGRKICGILIETHPEFLDRLVIGIGINANNSFQSAPEEIRHTATSMADVTGGHHNRSDVLVAVLQAIELEFLALSQNDPTQIDRCRQRCFLTGRLLKLKEVTSTVTGMCLGIDDDGALRLMTEVGPQRFLSGEITRID